MKIGYARVSTYEQNLYMQKEVTVIDICKNVGILKTTFYKYLGSINKI